MNNNNLVLLATLITSFLFGVWLNPPAPYTKKDLLRGLESQANLQALTQENKKLLIGFNANLDALVHNGPEFLRTLQGVDEFSVAKDTKTIQTAKEFGEVFSLHLSSSSAGERAVSNDTLWKEILQHLEKFSEEDDFKIGGNAALMSQAVAKIFDNVEVSLLGMVGPKIAGKLNSKIQVIHGKEGMISVDGVKYQALNDEIHLILEYPSNAKFGNSKSQRANRFIVSRDFSNGAIAPLETLSNILDKKFDAIVIAGVHLMDGMLPESARSKRLQEVKSVLSKLGDVRIHLELGSTGDLDFSAEILKTLNVNSLGLNEQEFFTICERLKFCTVEERTTMASSIPPVAKIQESISKLFNALPTVTRIHFHCFSYHIIAQKMTHTKSGKVRIELLP